MCPNHPRPRRSQVRTSPRCEGLRMCNSIGKRASEPTPDEARLPVQGSASSPGSPTGAISCRSARPGDITLSDLRSQLREIVLREGYLRLDDPIQLRSGEWSRDFVDGKRALAHGTDLELACRALLEMVTERGIDFDAVGGLTLGADQFAHGSAIVARKDWFVVRKEPKGRARTVSSKAPRSMRAYGCCWSTMWSPPEARSSRRGHR